MTERPVVNPGDWIKVENVDCVVAFVRPPELAPTVGDVEVVFDPKEPTHHDAEWTGERWVFCKRPDFGESALSVPRLNDAIDILRTSSSS